MNTYFNTVFAIFLRELKTRFGEKKLGIFFIILEPLIHILIIITIFSVIKHNFSNFSYTNFIILGLIPYLLFKNIVNALITSIEANKAIFIYKVIKPFHVYSARVLLEVLIYTTIFLVLIIGVTLVDENFILMIKPLQFLITISLLILFAISIGIIANIAYHKTQLTKIIVNTLLTMLYFGSAIFYPLWIVPQNFQLILSYNPILNFLELLKSFYFENYNLSYTISFYYIFFISIIMLYISLLLYKKYNQSLWMNK